MHSHVKLHQPEVKTDLPTQEQAARKRRAHTAALPGIPGTRAQLTPPVHKGGRKTLDLRLPNLRH